HHLAPRHRHRPPPPRHAPLQAPANEFKRRQLPPTLIISRNAIGIGRRRPVTHRYRRHVLKAVERAAESAATSTD
ncbi:MAG TPA: hypothetical protein VE775_12160, partial [Pyrinomonadaceae bacterium]|nr:hypothetical protein [Pyrinomonadaceae bacterium]